MSTCAKCGAEFTDASKYRPRKYCYACAPRVIKERRKPYAHTCGVCGAEYVSNNYSVYCSDACRAAAKRRRGRERYRRLNPLEPGKTRNRRNLTERELVCVECGRTFAAKRVAQRCSDCHAKYTYKPRYCADCGGAIPKGHRNCPSCHISGRRKFKISDARRLAIYERDNWTCWLCGEPVDPDDNPRSGKWYPTLDHIVPRCMGGNHTDDNLRCAHRTCNSSRGAKAA